MSAAEGWYADPDDPASLRWWDGSAWTEHREPAATAEPTPAPIVQVDAGKGARTSLVLTAEAVTIGSDEFRLEEIDVVQWAAVRSHINGAYMGVLYTLRVRAGDRKGDFAMNTGSKNIRYDEFAMAYDFIVGVLDAVVSPRLAEALLARIRSGETITLGPAGARVELSASGFRLKKPLSKVVPWSDVSGTELEGGRLYFQRRRGDEVKRHSMVGLEGENIVVLPHVVRHLTSVA